MKAKVNIPVKGNEYDMEFMKLLAAATEYYGKNCKKMVAIKSFKYDIKQNTEEVIRDFDGNLVSQLETLTEHSKQRQKETV